MDKDKLPTWTSSLASLRLLIFPLCYPHLEDCRIWVTFASSTLNKCFKITVLAFYSLYLMVVIRPYLNLEEKVWYSKAAVPTLNFRTAPITDASIVSANGI